MKKLFNQDSMPVNKKLIILTFALSLICIVAMPQQNAVRGAYGGSNGIFVYLKALTPETKDKVAYCVIERREAGKGDWKTVTTSRKPSNEAEFTKQLKNAVDKMPYDASYLIPKSRMIWKKYESSDSQDSLKLWFAMLPVQEALGIVYCDLTTKQGISYEYKIQQLDNSDNTLNTLYYLPVTWPGEKSKWNIPYRSYSALTDQVTVTWGMAGVKMPPYNKVFRQERNGGEWSVVNVTLISFMSKDSVFITATDTLVAPGAIYRYKLVPMDIFGNPGTESESDVVAAYNFNLQAPAIEDLKSANPDSIQGILLSWHLIRNDLVNSVIIYRSTDYDKDYEKIAEVPSTASSYIDQTIEPGIKYYYRLSLTGPMGEQSAPGSRVFAISDDRSKPTPPMITEAKGTTRGIQLTIKVTESSLSGVRVFRNSQDNTTMFPASNLLPVRDFAVTWEDTLNISPVKFYGYAAKAENASHLQGDLSDTVYCRSAKTIVTPEVIGLTADYNETFNQLYWTDMHFIEAPLGGYFVYRKELPGGEMKQLNDTIISPERNSYSDFSIAKGKAYSYSVILVDGFGNRSNQCNPVVVNPPVAPARPPLNVSGNAETEFIRISWDAVQSPSIKEYKVYRYIRGVKPVVIGTISANESTEFVDKNVTKGQLYFYYVITVESDGRQSNPSKEINVRKD